MTKKLFTLAAAALVMGFASCSKNDDGGANSGEDKAVKLRISGDFDGTRAEGPGSILGSEPTVSFISGHLYFVDAGGNIVKHLNITNDGAAVTATGVGINTLKTGATINVSSSAKTVHFIGNDPGTTIPTTGLFSNVRAYAVSIESQVNSTAGAYDLKNSTLYGEGTINTAVGDGSAGSPHTCGVTVGIISSRIEIGKFTQTGSVITGYKIEGIFLNYYYPSMNVDGTKSAAAMVTNGSDPAGYVDNSLTYTSYATANKYITYDYAAAGLGNLDVATSKIYTPATAGKVWAYNILAPQKISTSDWAAVPHIVVKVTGITPAGTFTEPQFLTVKGFSQSNVPLTKIEPGKIYKIASINFDDTNLTPEPEQTTFNVAVTITMPQWVIENVDADL